MRMKIQRQRILVAAVAMLLGLSVTCRDRPWICRLNGVNAERGQEEDEDSSSLTPLPSSIQDRQLIEERVKDLMKEMSLSHKIAQMAQIDISAASPSLLRSHSVASIVITAGSQVSARTSPKSWADAVDALQNEALASRHKIPVMFATDAVHGHSSVYGTTVFPHNIGLAAARDPLLTSRIGEATALEVRASGMHFVYGPSLTLCSNPRWSGCQETFGENPDVVRSMTRMISGLQGVPPLSHPNGYPFVDRASGVRVIACAKNFVGDGDGTDVRTVKFLEIYEKYLRQYLDALEKGVSAILVSSAILNGKKVRESHELITSVLKTQMGFKGIVVADWKGFLDSASSSSSSSSFSNYSLSLASAINAGVDMVMVPYDFMSFLGNMTTLVKNHEIADERIDDAVKRILRVKIASGLFEFPISNRILLLYVGSQKHQDLAREAARKSLVLLKNRNGVLPLEKNVSRILVAGSHAHNIIYQCGRSTVRSAVGRSILQGIESAVASFPTKVVYTDNSNDPYYFGETGEFSYGIVAVGEFPTSNRSSKGRPSDGLNIALDGVGVVRNVCARMKCVVVVVCGSAMFLDDVRDDVDALVVAWLPGSQGGAISDVIFGEYDFVGRLPVSWPSMTRGVPPFPLGCGLSMFNSSSSTSTHNPN